MAANPTPRIHRVLAADAAHVILRDAWFAGKNRDNPHAHWAAPGRNDDGWVIVDMPAQLDSGERGGRAL
jgi:hypothetical protein